MEEEPIKPHQPPNEPGTEATGTEATDTGVVSSCLNDRHLAQ